MVEFGRRVHVKCQLRSGERTATVRAYMPEATAVVASLAARGRRTKQSTIQVPEGLPNNGISGMYSHARFGYGASICLTSQYSFLSFFLQNI